MRLNSNGDRVLGWEKATEGETDLQRLRRRLQQRRCVACGAKERQRRESLCTPCLLAGIRFCTICERVVSLDRWRKNRICKDCANDYDRKRRVRLGALKQDKERRRQAAIERAAEMERLRQRGWTWAEVGRRFNVGASSASSHHSRYYTNLDKRQNNV